MPTYRMLGADGREYGPVSADQLRQWIAQHRANAQTRVRLEGSAEWKPLGQFPEFAPLFAAQPEPGHAPPPGGMAEAEILARQILERGYQLQIGHCIERGWELVLRHFWLAAGATFLIYMLSLAVAAIPFGKLLLAYVFAGGLDWMFLKLVRGQRAELGDAFAGFTLAFAPLLLFSLVGQLLTAIGFVFCILPGIYLLIAWHLFTPLLILDKRLDFWAAMELSRKVVTHHWWQAFGLGLLCLLCLLAGVLICCVGFFIALPVVTAAIVYAYEDIFGAQPALLGPAAPPAPAG
jgi:GYF domain 2